MPVRKEFRKSYQSADANNQPVYMTQEELEKLKILAEEKKKELDKASKEIGEATEQSSETRHDNAPFDAAVEQASMLNTQYTKILDKIRRVVVVTPPLENDKVVFGIKVEVLINLKMNKTFTISGLSNPKEGKITMSSPIGEAIMGKRVGEEGTFKVRNKESSVKILKILNQ